jgi:hypothetical protein
MKRVCVSAGMILVFSFCVAEAGTLFTNPVMVVTPMALDFAAVATNKLATNTFLVQNVGGGKLVGKATVAAPFKIIDGGNYELRTDEAQVVTLIYVPKSTFTNVQMVTFTGANKTTAKVIGRISSASPPARGHQH